MGRAQVRGVLILVTWLFLLGGRLAEPLLATQPDFPPIPEIDLPVVRLSQIMDESQYASSIRNEGYFKDKGDVWNYYRLESSLPVPEQHYLAESVELRSGGSEATNVYFHCDAYRAISPGVAKVLANSIAEGRKLYPYRSIYPFVLPATPGVLPGSGSWRTRAAGSDHLPRPLGLSPELCRQRVFGTDAAGAKVAHYAIVGRFLLSYCIFPYSRLG